MTKMDLEMKRRDTGRWEIAATNRLGQALDLTGATVAFAAKRKHTDADSAAVIRRDSAAIGGISITNAGAGLALLTIAPANTETLTKSESLPYDVQVTEADGTVTTVIEGTLRITLDITP